MHHRCTYPIIRHSCPRVSIRDPGCCLVGRVDLQVHRCLRPCPWDPWDPKTASRPQKKKYEKVRIYIIWISHDSYDQNLGEAWMVIIRFGFLILTHFQDIRWYKECIIQAWTHQIWYRTIIDFHQIITQQWKLLPQALEHKHEWQTSLPKRWRSFPSIHSKDFERPSLQMSQAEYFKTRCSSQVFPFEDVRTSPPSTPPGHTPYIHFIL